MSFAAEKRRLLGLLALIAPIPLPFNDNLAWPLLIVYLAAIVVFWIRAASGAERWLPDWALNVLGGCYLPVLALDLMAWGRGGLLRPILHLSLFVIVVKLWALRRERDKWQVLVGVLFVFFSAMGTSVHPTAVAYMLTMIALVSLALMRFAQFSLLTGVGTRHAEVSRELPATRIAILATLTAVIVAVPLFALLPRVSTPFILGRGQGTGTTVQSSGFTDIVSLDVVGSIRQSREVVMRIEDSPRLAAEELRLKAATYGLYDGRSWRREPGGRPLFRDDTAGGFALANVPSVTQVRAWLQPLGSTALPVPLETVHLDLPAIPTLEEDPGGGLRTWLPLSGTAELRLGLAEAPRVLDQPPAPEWLADPRYLEGITARMEQLAREIAGSGPNLERALLLERHLATQYAYTTDFVGVSGPEAIDEFLFEHRRGHCEYFASALVVLLRAQGIPSRLVTGFLGAERSPLEGYVVVRQLNAHAWVEAWDDASQRWITLDPTPAEGRPRSGADGSLAGMFRQAWDFLLFRWDRYVLSFGFEDQMALMQGLREKIARWLSKLGPQAAPGDSGAAPVADAETSGASSSAGTQRSERLMLWLALVVALALAAVLLARIRRLEAMSAAEAYRQLQRGVADIGIGPSVPPLELERRAVAALPKAQSHIRRIVREYVSVAFAGASPSAGSAWLAESLTAVASELRERQRLTRSRRGRRALRPLQGPRPAL